MFFVCSEAVQSKPVILPPKGDCSLLQVLFGTSFCPLNLSPKKDKKYARKFLDKRKAFLLATKLRKKAENIIRPATGF